MPCFGLVKDWDDTFAYSTPRFVKIRDRRLGILYYIFLLGIVGYILGYQFIYLQAYKLQGSIIGTVRLQLQKPASQYTYNASSLAYCGNSNYTSGGRTWRQHQCKFLDSYDAVFPRVENTAIMLSTRISEEHQILPPTCENLPRPACSYVGVDNTTYFVGNPEFFTLLLDHTMNVPSLGISRSNPDMSGSLESEDGTTFDRCAAYTSRGWECPHILGSLIDVYSIQSLLDAAGINLDSPAGSTQDLTKQTHRNAGVILLIEILYDNYYTYDPNKVKYTYRVSAVTDTEFKGEEVLPGPDSGAQSRTIIDRHGIRIIVKQDGRVGKFNFQTLLIQLVSSLGLLAVAKLIVDTLAMNILPCRHVYSQYKTVKSFDMSDIGPEDMQLFKNRDLVNRGTNLKSLLRRARTPLPTTPGESEAASDSDEAPMPKGYGATGVERRRRRVGGSTRHVTAPSHRRDASFTRVDPDAKAPLLTTGGSSTADTATHSRSHAKGSVQIHS